MITLVILFTLLAPPPVSRRTAEWSRSAFTPQAVQQFMLETLRSAAREGKPFPPPGKVKLQAAEQPGGGNTSAAPPALEVDGKRLPKVTCGWLKARHKKVAEKLEVDWQVDEWYDDKCEFKDTGYLKRIPV